MPATAKPGSGLLSRFASAPKHQPNSFLFEDRASLIADLIEYKYAAKKDAAWVETVKTRLSQTPAFMSLANSLRDVTKTESFEPQVINIIDAALRLAERHPVAAFGRDTQSLILESVEDAIQKSTPIRLVRWGAPLLIALIFGGTVFWGVKLDGLEKARQDVEKTLVHAKSEADGVITKFRLSLAQESKDKLGELTSLVTDAKANATNTINDEVRSLPTFFKGERTRLANDGNASLNVAVDKLITPDAINELKNTISDLSTRIEANKKLVEENKKLVTEVNNLRAMLETSNDMAYFTPSQILRLLAVKDWIAIGAAAISILAFIFSFFAFRRRRPGR